LKPTYDPEEGSYESLDLFLFFFLCIYSLRDWLKAYTPEAHVYWERRFKGELEWKVCRDINNSFKHLKVSSPSLDVPLTLIRHFHESERHQIAVLADARVIPLMDVAEKLWSEICQFVRDADELLPPRGRGVADEFSG